MAESILCENTQERCRMVSPQGKKNKKKELAKESFKTQRAREKLQKRLEMMDSQITRS